MDKPPFFIASSEYSATNEAIKETRTKVNLTNWLALAIPANPDGIRMVFFDELSV